ncbi:MAG: M24 family metallopeptidase [Armatimonadota bacterium]
MRQRREAVRAWMAREGLDALLVSSRPNVRYLTGFAGEGLLVIDGGELICTDSRYCVQAAEEAPGIDCVAEGGHLEQAIERLRATGATRIGFRGQDLSYANWRTLSDKLEGAELVACDGEIERLRAVKDETEIALIARAAQVADAAFAQWRGWLQPGVSEREAALELERLMVLAGADKASFEVIVAGGPNAAKPHAAPGTRAIRAGELVVVDWGASVEGYCSDCTRTVILGEPDQRQREIWQAVRAAQQAALAVVRPGAACREVDEVAREALRAAGWEKQFGHGLGHGVGLQVHEPPSLSQKSEDVLAPGMVVTIEPGVYIEGWGGVRLEELVLVTQEGCQALTGAPYDL